MRLKWLGVLSVFAGIFEFINWLMGFLKGDDYVDPTYYVSTISGLSAAILFIFTLVGIYLIHLKASGWYNHFCFFIGVIGTALFSGTSWLGTFAEPWIYSKAPDLMKGEPGFPLMDGIIGSFFLFILTIFLVGILLLIHGKLPRWLGVLFLLGPVFEMLPIVSEVGQLLFAISIILIGIYLSKKTIDPAEST